MSDKKEIVVATSGYFDPIHVGHLEIIKEAKKLGDKLVVIVNGDGCAIRKKGFVFMPEAQRLEIVKSLKWVDDAFIWDDGQTTTVTGALEKLKPDIFAKGGDRTDVSRVPEAEICDKLGIKIVFGVGKDYQQEGISSSQFLGRYANRGEASGKPQQKTVFVAASMGHDQPERETVKKIVEHLKGKDVSIMNEHIALDDNTKPEHWLKEKDLSGLSRQQVEYLVEKTDMEWIDKASHVIAEVTGTSIGTGREIEYARLKGKVGKAPAKVLCLYNKDKEVQASGMVRGMDPERYLNVQVYGYSDVLDALKAIDNFLA